MRKSCDLHTVSSTVLCQMMWDGGIEIPSGKTSSSLRWQYPRTTRLLMMYKLTPQTVYEDARTPRSSLKLQP